MTGCRLKSTGKRCKKVIALVPMKEQSERIPLKNIKKFVNKPLLCHIIQTLQDSDYVKKVVVNTDSEAIRNIIKKYFSNTVQFINRPKHLCGNYVSMNKIIGYDLGVLRGEHFLQTHATNPLLKKETIDDAIRTYFSLLGQDVDSIVSVTCHNGRFYTCQGAPINHSPKNLLRTQDTLPIYEENSNIYIFSRESFKKRNNRIGGKPFFYKMNKLEAVDIDYEEDFKLSELLCKYMRP